MEAGILLRRADTHRDFRARSNPALAVPVGFNAAGLSMGIQIAGPNHGEMGCLQLARAYDQATGWTRKHLPPLLRQS